MYLIAVWSWISAHPLEVAAIVWIVFNVAWAQLPQPKNPVLAKLWNGLHAALQLIVTPAAAKGTFKLPWLLDVIVKALLNAPATTKDPPAAASCDDKKPTAKDAGDTNGPSGTA